jgi:hypothetical protein
MENKCLRCRLWDQKLNSPSTGLCRKYAPRENYIGNWPDTKKEDWCGEFEQTEEKIIFERNQRIEKRFEKEINQ